MNVGMSVLERYNRVQVAAGGIVWLVVFVARMKGMFTLSDPTLLLSFALLVIVPLALPLVASPGTCSDVRSPLKTRLTRLGVLVCPVAALLGAASFFVGAGLLAGLAAGAWLLFTALLALLGLARLISLRAVGMLTLAETCLSLALLYLPIGGAWFVAARLGIRPLGFSQTTVLLTAIHFHYITLAALVMTGLIGRVVATTGDLLSRRIYRVAALGMLASPLLVATGITLTQVTGVHLVESCAALVQALSLILISLLGLRYVVPTATPSLARALLAMSGVAVFFTMLAAVAYATGAATGAWTITIAQMVAVHGWINALVFGLCGLLGWRLRAHAAQVQTSGE